MKFKHFVAAIALCLLGVNASSQCKTTCRVKVTNTKTGEVLNNTYTVEVKTGWDLWILTGDASYKSNSDLIYALVYMSGRTVVMKAFKGTGPSLIWSGASPSVNCDLFPWGGFSVVDGSGNKGYIKASS